MSVFCQTKSTNGSILRYCTRCTTLTSQHLFRFHLANMIAFGVRVCAQVVKGAGQRVYFELGQSRQ